MPLPASWTTVTPLSKTIALILFFSLPVAGFFLGMRYQQMGGTLIPPSRGCTMEAKICPDGTAVGRSGPNCEFTPCPTQPPGDGGSGTCTMDAKQCPDGSFVGRSGPNCEFLPCPTGGPAYYDKQSCGGIQGKLCPRGWYCKLDDTYPDASGTCIQDERNDSGKQTGTLDATVLFTGTPCKPGSGTSPPCDGPYPEYIVTIYDQTGQTLVASEATDAQGKAMISLAPGKYVWLQNEKSFAEKNRTAFVITAGATTTQTFTVDTGIR